MKQGASKRPQPRPNLSGRPTTREELMRRHREEKRERAQSRFQNMTKEERDSNKLKPRNRFDKGGKTKKSNTTTSGIPGVGRPKTTRQGAPDKMKSIGVKSIQTGEMMSAASDKARKIKDLSTRKGVGETVKPTRKKRRLRRRK